MIRIPDLTIDLCIMEQEGDGVAELCILTKKKKMQSRTKMGLGNNKFNAKWSSSLAVVKWQIPGPRSRPANNSINADGKYFCKILNNSVVLEQFVAAGYHDR